MKIFENVKPITKRVRKSLNAGTAGLCTSDAMVCGTV